MCVPFPFDVLGRVWYSIVSVPGHYRFIYLLYFFFIFLVYKMECSIMYCFIRFFLNRISQVNLVSESWIVLFALLNTQSKYHLPNFDMTYIAAFEVLTYQYLTRDSLWAAPSEFVTYRLCEQRRFRRACASAQSRQNLRCSLIQTLSQEEPSDRKPDP